jgi:hypothetical protein
MRDGRASSPSETRDWPCERAVRHPPATEHTAVHRASRLSALAELRTRDQRVVWDYIYKSGKWDKPPLNPHTEGWASTADPATWASYETAAYRALRDGLSGVGYVLTSDDGLTGIDLDDCRDKVTGALKPLAAEIIALAETYAEISPSGTGVRLFVRGKISSAMVSHPIGVEVYATGRYLTITGQHVTGTPDEIRPAPQTLEVLRLRVEASQASAGAGAADSTGPREAPSDLDTFWKRVNAAALEQMDRWVPDLLPKARRYAGGWRVTSCALESVREVIRSVRCGA